MPQSKDSVQRICRFTPPVDALSIVKSNCQLSYHSGADYN
jgi:hypothetical protein